MALGLLAVPTAIGGTAAADPLAEKRAEAEQVASQLSDLEARLMDLSARHERSRFELAKVEADLAEARDRADATRSERERRLAELRTFAVQAYTSGSDSPLLSALLTSTGDTAPQKKAYVEAATGDRQDLIDALGAAGQRADEEAAGLAEAQGEATRLNAEIESAKAEGERAAAELRAVSARVQGELADLVAQEEARRAEEEAARRAAATTTTTAPPARAAASSTATAARPAAPATAPTAPSAEAAPAPGPVSPGVEGAIQAALGKQGSGYVWGAAGPSSFDCSGLLVWAFRQAGISLPHYSGAQYNLTSRVSRADLQRGDLVFWGSGGSDHVALYLGGNQIVHSFPSGGGVGVTKLDGWWKTPSGYGRL